MLLRLIGLFVSLAFVRPDYVPKTPIYPPLQKMYRILHQKSLLSSQPSAMVHNPIVAAKFQAIYPCASAQVPFNYATFLQYKKNPFALLSNLPVLDPIKNAQGKFTQNPKGFPKEKMMVSGYDTTPVFTGEQELEKLRKKACDVLSDLFNQEDSRSFISFRKELMECMPAFEEIGLAETIKKQLESPSWTNLFYELKKADKQNWPPSLAETYTKCSRQLKTMSWSDIYKIKQKF